MIPALKGPKYAIFMPTSKLQGYAIYILTSPKWLNNANYVVPTPQGKIYSIYLGTIP